MIPKKFKNSLTDISFHSNGFVLRGTLHMPCHKHSDFIVIGSHGLLSNSSSPKQIELAKCCTEQGMGFFRFDHRGCGKSDGIFRKVTTLKGRCDDLTAAITTIKNRTSTPQQIGLFGSSLGGAACISVANRFCISTIVTFAAPVNNRSIIDAVKKSDDYTEDDLEFYQKNLQFDIADNLSEISNILVFHGDSDDVVDLSHGEKIYNIASEPKKMIIQKGGDHSMGNREHQKSFVREAASWFKSYDLG